jgi:hypothetical protein
MCLVLMGCHVISSPFSVGEKTCLGTLVYFTIRANFVGGVLEHAQKLTHKHMKKLLEK